MQKRLDQSLHNTVRLTLGMERQDYRVQRPWSAAIAQPNQTPVPLDTNTSVVDVFDRPDLNRQLLILGKPGAGKTTMMLDLAQALAERARIDNTEPIPVLVNLSSWKDPKLPIVDWLVGELKEKYGLRQDLAKQWIQTNQLLPLLDGLDEVAPQNQQACAKAINAWLTGELEQRPCGVLICCRREEFEQVVQQPLNLYGAIYLQPLTPAQIKGYFTQFGLQGLWQTVRTNKALYYLLTNPLFLSMFGLVQTQKTFSLELWQAKTTSRQKVEYLLDTYWEAVMNRELITNPNERNQGILSRTYGTKPLPKQQTIRRSLIFVAKMLNRESSTEFLIEKLQPATLITQHQKWLYQSSFMLVAGLMVWLMAGLMLELTVGLNAELMVWLMVWLMIGLMVGLMIGLMVGLDTIDPVEAISFPSSREVQEIFQRLCRWLILLLMVGLMVGLIFWLILWLMVGLMVGLDRLIGALISMLILGLILGLTFELKNRVKADIQSRIQPNQGIKNSIKNMVIVSAIALLLALSLKLLLEFLLPMAVAPELVPRIVAFSLSPLIWLGFLEGGGRALIQHVALRLVLAANGYAPFRYDLLLNYCTERLLLQRVGGRYRFMHKLLQDYFARMELR